MTLFSTLLPSIFVSKRNHLLYFILWAPGQWKEPSSFSMASPDHHPCLLPLGPVPDSPWGPSSLPSLWSLPSLFTPSGLASSRVGSWGNLPLAVIDSILATVSNSPVKNQSWEPLVRSSSFGWFASQWNPWPPAWSCWWPWQTLGLQRWAKRGEDHRGWRVRALGSRLAQTSLPLVFSVAQTLFCLNQSELVFF